MKYFLIVLLISISAYSFGQFSFGVKAGLNINNIAASHTIEDYNDDVTSSIGFHLGAYGAVKLGENFSFIPEMQFSQRGFKGSSKSRLNLNYIEVPLLISYAPIKWIRIDIGPNFGYQISAVARGSGTSTNLDEYYDKNLDVGLIGGLRFPVTEKFSIIGRYYMGLISFLDTDYRDSQNDPITVKVYTRTVQLGLSYQIK